MGTTLTLFFSCSIYIDIDIMAKQTRNKTTTKKIGTSPYNYTPSKGIKIEGESEAVQDDSTSLLQMIEKHVQGVLDPTDYKQGQYDEEGATEDDFDRDVEDRSQITELEALEYAKEHGMTLEQVQQEVDLIRDIDQQQEQENVPEVQEQQSIENDEE